MRKLQVFRIVFGLGLLFIAWPAHSAGPSPVPTPAPRVIRFLHPARPQTPQLQIELNNLIDEFQRKTPGVQVQLVMRGQDFSSLRELIAMVLSENPPELAVVESNELPSLERLQLTHEIKDLKIDRRFRTDHPHSIPFERTLPILVANEEEMFHAGINPSRLPERWPEVIELARKLSGLALPLQGPRGLWIFEAMAGKPLWNREPGGLRANRELGAPIHSLQSILDTPKLAHPDDTWDRAAQSFIERRTALLVSSLDMLPWLTQNIPFRWVATPLPGARMQMGSDLVITSEDPVTRAFVRHLYEPSNGARWARAGAFLPLHDDWTRQAIWKAPWMKSDRFQKLVSRLRAEGHRTSDREIVRARTAWVQAMHLLFGSPERRLPIETVLSQIDRNLGQDVQIETR